MRLELAYITPRRHRLKSAPAQLLVEEYVTRASRYAPCQAVAYETEEALLAALERPARTAIPLWLLDSRGQPLTSEGFARQLGGVRDRGVQQLTLGIGPADGWSAAAWQRGTVRVSLGAMTLPHELALVVVAEQVYRALTILAGHPYHSGHEGGGD